MRSIFAFLALTLLAPTALAGETAWQEVAPGVRLRLISTGQIKPDGQTLLGIEIDMPAGTKTYWRVPGETGLPTELDFSASPGVTGHQILWPYPTLDTSNGYADYVYYGPTVPAQVEFSLALSEPEPDRANGLRLRQAMALAPIDWDGSPSPLGDVTYDPDTGMLEIPLSNAELDPTSLIAATPSGLPLFGAPQKSPEPDLVLIPVLGQVDATDLANQPVELTFMTDDGAFAIDSPVTVAPAD